MTSSHDESGGIRVEDPLGAGAGPASAGVPTCLCSIELPRAR
jgi:hypothetical protein